MRYLIRTGPTDLSAPRTYTSRRAAFADAKHIAAAYGDTLDYVLVESGDVVIYRLIRYDNKWRHAS